MGIVAGAVCKLPLAARAGAARPHPLLRRRPPSRALQSAPIGVSATASFSLSGQDIPRSPGTRPQIIPGSSSEAACAAKMGAFRRVQQALGGLVRAGPPRIGSGGARCGERERGPLGAFPCRRAALLSTTTAPVRAPAGNIQCCACIDSGTVGFVESCGERGAARRSGAHLSPAGQSAPASYRPASSAARMPPHAAAWYQV